jgi:hypothetical protein
MKDRRNRLVAAIIATVIIIFLIIFKQGSVTDSFVDDFDIQEVNTTKQVYVYNDFDGLPAIGTYVYKYEMNEVQIDISEWKQIPFDNDYIDRFLELADVEIIRGYYIYNESDNNEDSYYYFDIAILNTDTNVLYHMMHKSS